MIRYITGVEITDVSDGSYNYRVDIIPASGTFRTTSEEDGSGRFEKVEFSLRTEQPHRLDDWYRRDLILTLHFSDGSLETVGNESVPVRLKTDKASTFAVSVEYTRPV